MKVCSNLFYFQFSGVIEHCATNVIIIALEYAIRLYATWPLDDLLPYC